MSTFTLVMLVIITYMLIEFIGGILFNWRLLLLRDKKFTAAGVFSAFSVVMLLSSFVVSTVIGSNDNQWWIVPVSAISMGLGNLFAAMLVPKIRKYIVNRKKEE